MTRRVLAGTVVVLAVFACFVGLFSSARDPAGGRPVVAETPSRPTVTVPPPVRPASPATTAVRPVPARPRPVRAPSRPAVPFPPSRPASPATAAVCAYRIPAGCFLP